MADYQRIQKSRKKAMTYARLRSHGECSPVTLCTEKQGGERSARNERAINE